MCQPFPTKLSVEFIGAEGSSATRTQFDTVKTYTDTEYQTIAICPPSTESDDARKCKCWQTTLSPLAISPTMSSPSVISAPCVIRERSPPPSQCLSTIRPPSITSFGPESPQVHGLSPPPSQPPFTVRSPSVGSFRPESPEIHELSPPPSQISSSWHLPSVVTIEGETSIVSPSVRTRSERTQSVVPVTIPVPPLQSARHL